MRNGDCGCDYPILTRITDRRVSHRRKKSGLLTVERYLDCLVHGPQSIRLEVADVDTAVEAARKVGAPRNMEMRRA